MAEMRRECAGRYVGTIDTLGDGRFKAMLHFKLARGRKELVWQHTFERKAAASRSVNAAVRNYESWMERNGARFELEQKRLRAMRTALRQPDPAPVVCRKAERAILL